jgi:hypothetical protein
MAAADQDRYFVEMIKIAFALAAIQSRHPSTRGRPTRSYTAVLGLEVLMDTGWIVTVASVENPTAQSDHCG